MQIVLREKIQCVRRERTTEGNKTHESYGGKRLRCGKKKVHIVLREKIKCMMEKNVQVKKRLREI